jgi:hypothetical protein
MRSSYLDCKKNKKRLESTQHHPNIVSDKLLRLLLHLNLRRLTLPTLLSVRPRLLCSCRLAPLALLLNIPLHFPLRLLCFRQLSHHHRLKAASTLFRPESSGDGDSQRDDRGHDGHCGAVSRDRGSSDGGDGDGLGDGVDYLGAGGGYHVAELVGYWVFWLVS